MPTVNGHQGKGHQGGQVVRNSTHDSQDIQEMQRDAKARDNLKGAYAGNENEGVFKRKDHPTDLKARKTKKSSTRTPEV